VRLGLLFDHEYDARAHARIGHADGLQFARAGFDLFSFPSNAALVGFDLERFAHRQAERARREGWAGVVSHDEQFGALAAALVAERAGLPGAAPRAIVMCQHKLAMRRLLDEVCPEANVGYEPLACGYGDPIPAGLAYPRFVKPVKAAFSVLARAVPDRASLQAHTRFGRRELWVIRHLVEPFERVARRLVPEAGTAHRMLLEEVVHAPQYNLDGFVHEGKSHVLGVVDALMYPGTQAFQRWEFPSRLPAAVIERAGAVAARFLAAAGYRQGFFNMEFFHDPASDRLAVIEFNPRLASQFGDFYRQVLGVDPHRMAIALAAGADPWSVPRVAPAARVAASLVWRAFDPDAVPAMPGARSQARLTAALPGAALHLYPHRGRALARDFKWMGNTRYGVLNLGAPDAATLSRDAALAARLLGWPNAPYAGAVGERAARHADFTPALGNAD
jgi:hypothetical protein